MLLMLSRFTAKKEEMPKARLLIVDDHALMCQGLRAILEPEYRVVAEVHDGESVPAAVALHRPDVVLLDLSLPGKSGTEVLQDLLATGSPPAVVVLTMHVERALAEHMIALGARAFVPKDARLAELRNAIDAARMGQRYISPRVPRTPTPTRTAIRAAISAHVSGATDCSDDRCRLVERPDRGRAAYQLSHGALPSD